jgi:hypothetical protein
MRIWARSFLWLALIGREVAMKVWLLVVTIVYLNSPDEKLSLPRWPDLYQLKHSLEGGECLDHHCMLGLLDTPPFTNKEACERAGAADAAVKRKEGSFIGMYKCLEVEISSIDQQGQNRCPAELEEGYRRALQGIKTGNPVTVLQSTQAITAIRNLQNSLSCQM